MIDEIPPGLVDADNNYTAAYYGIISIFTNTLIVPNAPQTWADLKKPEYEGVVALNGDPRESGSGFAAVMAASFANGGNADDIMPGIEFFAELKESGNLVATDVVPATVALRRHADLPRLELQHPGPGRPSSRKRASRTRRTSRPTVCTAASTARGS